MYTDYVILTATTFTQLKATHMFNRTAIPHHYMNMTFHIEKGWNYIFSIFSAFSKNPVIHFHLRFWENMHYTKSTCQVFRHVFMVDVCCCLKYKWVWSKMHFINPKLVRIHRYVHSKLCFKNVHQSLIASDRFQKQLSLRFCRNGTEVCPMIRTSTFWQTITRNLAIVHAYRPRWC